MSDREQKQIKTKIESGDIVRPEQKHKRDRHMVNQSEIAGVPPIVQEVLHSPGQPLDAETRAFYEPRFGHDFGSVRVHADAKAAESARTVNALAYTAGQQIVFGTRQYAPGTAAGRELLSHELVHVVQQKKTTMVPLEYLPISPSDAKTEYEADLTAQQIVTGGQVKTMHRESIPPLVQRQTPSPTVGRSAKLALNLPRQQLKAIGNPDINAIVDALPSPLFNGQRTVIKRAHARNTQHVFELAITIQPGSPPVTATEAAEVTEKALVNSGQTSTHSIALNIFQAIPDPIMTLYHELVHVQLIMDRWLPADQQSETYGKFAQRWEMASDPALLAVTGARPKKEAVFTSFARFRAWYKTFVTGFQMAPALDGPNDEERYRTLINEYFANKEARRAFNKPEPNLLLAKRYAEGARAQFQVAAQGQGLLNTLVAARQTQSSMNDFDVAEQLSTALVALFDALDQQLQEIEKFKQSPPTTATPGTSNPYPRPLQIGGQPVPKDLNP